MPSDRKPRRRFKAALLKSEWSLPAGIECDCPCIVRGNEYCHQACYHRSGEGHCFRCDGSGVTMRGGWSFLARALRETIEAQQPMFESEGKLNILTASALKNRALAAFDSKVKSLGIEVEVAKSDVAAARKAIKKAEVQS